MSLFGITLNCFIAFTTLDTCIYLLFQKNIRIYIIVKMDVSLFILEIKFLIAEGYIGQNHNEIYFYGVRMSISLISYKEKTHFFVI